MKLKEKIWMIVVLVIILLIPTTILFYQNQVLKEQVAKYAGEQNINHKVLTKSLQRAETKIAENSDELVVFADQNGINIQAVEEDLESLNGRLEAVGVTESKTFNITHHHHPSDSNIPSEIEVPICEEDGRPIDIHGYTKNVETRELTDSNGMRVADVSFSAAQKRPWSSTVYGREYLISSVISKNNKGGVILHTELSAASSFNPEKRYKITGIESKVLQIEQSPEFKIWDPSLFININLELGVYPEISLIGALSLSFGVMSYGNWRFLIIGAGYEFLENSFIASLSPFRYNVGDPIPILSNLFIGPEISIDLHKNVGIGLSIGCRL